jgi:hypothetical protein
MNVSLKGVNNNMLYVFGLSPVFDDIIFPLITALKQRGLYAERIWEITHESRSDDLFIMFGLNSYDGVMPKKYISYQLEQTSSVFLGQAAAASGHTEVEGETKTWFTDSYLKRLENSFEIWDYSLQNIVNIKALFKQKGLQLPRIKYVPITHMLTFATNINSNENKDIDVLFYGSVNERREKIISDLQTAGHRVYLGGYNLWGEERQKLIERAKIVLNIHFFKEPILEATRLAPLVSQGAFVISEPSSDRMLDKFWSNMVTFCRYEEIVSTVSKCLNDWDTYKDFGSRAQQELMKHPFLDELKVNLDSIESFVSDPLPSTDVSAAVSDNTLEKNQAPMDHTERKKIRKASCKSQTLEDGSKAEILELIDISDNDLPSVSIVTPTHNRSELLPIALRNFHKTIYPFDKLEWVVLDDSSVEEQQKNYELLKGDFRIRHIQLNEKMSMVSEAISEYIVHMDDDDYYNPESVLARVKLLLKYKNEGVRCVGCTEIGIYHLLDNYSYLMDCGSYLSEASMAYHRSFWEDRPFPSDKEMAKMSTKTGEGALFLENRLNEVIDMPFIFNFIAVTHKKNVTGRLRTYNLDSEAKRNGTNFFNLWDIDTQLFFIKVSRQCRQHNF